MDFGLSTYFFVNERLSSHILDQILAMGIRQIEIFAARQHLDYHDVNQVSDVAQWFRDHGLELFSLHAPLYSDFDWGRSGGPALSITYLERRQRIESMEEIKRALDIADRLPFRYLVLHMGRDNEEYELAKFDAALTCLEHLKIFAKERGVQILLENIPNEVSTPERLIEFIEYTRLNEVRFCFDVGHAHMVGDVPSAFGLLKDRIVSTHIHDNRREKDDHLFPFDGEIDWERTIRDFRSVDGQFPLMLELRNYGPEVTTLARIREVMERLEAIR
jgi:sugar phosphate isomerase/epimerase